MPLFSETSKSLLRLSLHPHCGGGGGWAQHPWVRGRASAACRALAAPGCPDLRLFFYPALASDPVLLPEGLKFALLKAQFFIFNGKIDKCCTEHLLFEDLQGKIDTRQLPSSGRYSWRTTDKTTLCSDGGGGKTVRSKNANVGTARSGTAGREPGFREDVMLFMPVLLSPPANLTARSQPGFSSSPRVPG